ncbi:HypC/HybG/HupF family hydrogenase formation chaperone [Desulfohalobium retbaense]|jgi:hydrogenase expression/formation protein HypC|uniref:Hydrogenase assembly chaperone hypC/hupF n=1 Tax=Desulfohalobium retbaense (strain ATCC 49708 / DSM 5692 / JCM 16813 / HR100) TaxID=485915 RepID=C8WZU5_DESRD|nr:HypC/HybG/HupF family hydrogenase formation chaperone [Desulfohalobium retbaense]ACV67570.1 hydrogenase assembly chaperone hypC/hupF [Desulfohalobium retbaense DSM 5692]
MCLAVPVRIESIENEMAVCSVGESGTTLKASLMLLEEEPQIGDYVIVHAGFALRILDPQEAQESLQILREMAQVGQVV